MLHSDCFHHSHSVSTSKYISAITVLSFEVSGRKRSKKLFSESFIWLAHLSAKMILPYFTNSAFIFFDVKRDTGILRPRIGNHLSKTRI